MRSYLERLDAPGMTPAPDAGYPRIIAANGLRMLDLAAEVADGAIPAGLPPEYTARARQVLGPDKLLVIGSISDMLVDAMVAHGDPDSGRGDGARAPGGRCRSCDVPGGRQRLRGGYEPAGDGRPCVGSAPLSWRHALP
jgi:hypothetical protein